MAYRLFGANPLPESMMSYHQLHPQELQQESIKNTINLIQENTFQYVV